MHYALPFVIVLRILEIYCTSAAGTFGVRDVIIAGHTYENIRYLRNERSVDQSPDSKPRVQYTGGISSPRKKHKQKRRTSDSISSFAASSSSPSDRYRLYRVRERFDPADRRRDLWLLGLFPFAGQWTGGRGQLTAVEMALRDVNQADILPGYRLRMTVNDTRVSGSPLG